MSLHYLNPTTGLWERAEGADGAINVNILSGGSGGGGSSSADRELVVTTYICKTAFSGASIGDSITATQVIDVSAAPTTISTIWRNQTTSTDLVSAPSAANLEIVGSTALTNAQLREAPVPVTGPLTNAEIAPRLGAAGDAVATSDTGSFSLIALVKRSLTNWSTLLTRIPSLVSGRVPVAVDAAAATSALQTTGNASLASLDTKQPTLVSGRIPVTSQDTNGEGAVTYITNTTAVTGLSARQVVCLTDTVFSTFTRTNATGSITGVALPAGTLLTGPVTAITLTSGAVAAYA